MKAITFSSFFDGLGTALSAEKFSHNAFGSSAESGFDILIKLRHKIKQNCPIFYELKGNIV
jgi:hypothetical protein